MTSKKLNPIETKYFRFSILCASAVILIVQSLLLVCSFGATKDLTYERSRAIDRAARDIFNPFVSNAQFAKEIQDIVRYTLPETKAVVLDKGCFVAGLSGALPFLISLAKSLSICDTAGFLACVSTLANIMLAVAQPTVSYALDNSRRLSAPSARPTVKLRVAVRPS